MWSWMKRFFLAVVVALLVVSFVFAGVMKNKKPSVKVKNKIIIRKVIYTTKWEPTIEHYKSVDLGTVSYNIYRYHDEAPELNDKTSSVNYINDLLDDYGITLDWHYNGDDDSDTQNYSGTKEWTKLTDSHINTWVTSSDSYSSFSEDLGGGDEMSVTLVTTTYTTHYQEEKTYTTYSETANVSYTQEDPLVLDLDDNGVADVPKGVTAPHNFFEASRARLFDINGDNILDLIEWIGPNDGLLAIKTDNGINTAKELLSNAIGYANGFEKLSVLVDKNHDNWISGDELNSLVVWRDMNGDAIAQPNEVKPVSYYGIVKIYIVPDDDMASYYITKDGKKHLMWEWWPSAFLSIGVRK